mgnify:FL=1
MTSRQFLACFVLGAILLQGGWPTARAGEPLTCPDGRHSVYNTQDRKWLQTLTQQEETYGLVERALEGPLADIEEIVFAVRQRGPGHFYETFGHDFRLPDRFSHSPGGGRMCRLNLRTGEVSVILDDPEGAVRDPYLSYDARKMLFSWRKAGTDIYLVYEMNVDGSGLRRITDGEGGRFDDVEPIYLPDGDIMFVSGRARRGVPCWTTQVGLCYRCEADGSDVRMVSNGIEHEITPWPLPDGRILYTRWEYVNRSATQYHHLWVFNPDGTAAMTYYGNHHPGFAMTEARPIPGSDRVVSIFGSDHGNNEREGFVALIEPDRGPDDKAAAPMISAGYPEHVKDPECWRDPYPLGDGLFLVACEERLYIMDDRGRFETLYRLDEALKVPPQGWHKSWIHEPRPLAPRPREPVIPDRVDFGQKSGRLVLEDISTSRDRGVSRRGNQVDRLVVIEVLPMPVSLSWTADSAYVTNGSYNIKRILGTVPVHEDGSAYIEVPAMRPIYFLALDEDNNVIKEMNSFTSVMPGETTGCVGCHEPRLRAPSPIGRGTLAAVQEPPAAIEPLKHVPESGIFHMPRDIQPIFDRHCASCHNYEKYAAGLVLKGDRGVRFLNSLAFLEKKGRNNSGLVGMLQNGHHDVQLSGEEMTKLRWWTTVKLQHSGTYASFGTAGDECDMPFSHPKGPHGHENPDAVALDFDESVLERRCDSCHLKGERNYGHSKYTGRGWPRGRDHDHVFNMTEPEKSLLVLAPLSREAGGYGRCRKMTIQDFDRKYRAWNSEFRGREPTEPRAVVFEDKSDPDYEALLAELRRMSRHLKKRRTFPHTRNWRPVGDYLRAMKLYGVLPPGYEMGENPLDPFAIDEAYYRLFYDARTGEEEPLQVARER